LAEVTKRKEVEEALRWSESRYRAVVEQATEGIFLVDVRTMSIIESNAALCASLGYTADELGRLTLYDIVAHDPESVDWNVRRTLEEGRCHIGERKYRREDGSLADVDVHASVVPHADRDVLSVVAYDVSGRKRTEENLRRSLGVLLALREAGQILGSTLETEEIVTRLLTIMRGVSGLTAAVISVENEAGQPKIWREVGLEGLWRKARYAPDAEGARRMVLDNGEHRLFRVQNPEGSGQLVGLCLPLRMKDRIAGVLEAYGPESLAGEEAVEILRSLAAQAASALENARLYGELAERERRLADLIGQLFTAQEEERRRVAYEVHDGLAQVAAAAHQHLQGFANFYPPDSADGRTLLSQTLGLVQHTVGEARRVIANLRPTALDDFGLGTALRIETDRLRDEDYHADYESNLKEDERLPIAAETALFRIAQEALTNVRKHADTRRVRVTLDRLGNRARLGVRDWGRGFDPAAPRVEGGPGERVGLNSMQERVALLGGSFLVESRPGTGAVVRVEIPLPAEDPDEGSVSPMRPADREEDGWPEADLRGHA
jgi:PAS domain S-box-containing protein